MEVRCPRCEAIYRVDDTKIPDKGAYGRCPKCEMKFLVQKGTSKILPQSPPIEKISDRIEAPKKKLDEQTGSAQKETLESEKTSFWGLLLILAFAPFAIWLFWDTISDWRTSWSPPQAEISAIQLMEEYSKDEIAADLKYKGKVILVSGKVRSRSRDLLQDIFVLLYAGRGVLSVQCYFTDNQATEVVKLKRGQSARIKGVVDGKLGNVFLRNCEIVR